MKPSNNVTLNPTPVIVHISHKALQQGLVKYLIDQDTHVTQTLTKHNKALARLGDLLSLQRWSAIQVNTGFSVPSIELFDQTTKYSSELVTSTI